MLHQANLRISEMAVSTLERTVGMSSIAWMEAITYMIKAPLAILMILIRKGDARYSR